MRNTAVGVRNPTNNWNPESNVSLTRSGIQYLESGFLSLRSKRFHVVSGQTRRKTEEERDFRFGSAKMERDPFFAWSLSPVPRSLLSKLHRNACYAG